MNTRNMVSGLLNSKTFDISRVRTFILCAYWMYPTEKLGILPQSEQLKIMASLGFE